jgi:hypothetical protein
MSETETCLRARQSSDEAVVDKLETSGLEADAAARGVERHRDFKVSV